jgi:hypothetical protein
MKAVTKIFLLGLACACALSASAQVSVPGTFKHITIDGSFDDWTGVPLAYTAPEGPANAIQYENVYIANDQTNVYIRFTLYSPRPSAFANSYDNIFVDADDNSGTGYPVGGIGSEMLIQGGIGYQERNGGFNEGAINGLGWNIAGSADSTDFEIAISLGATYASDGTVVFANSTIALLLEGDNTSYVNTAFAPPAGGFVYTFAPAPGTVSTNETLVGLEDTSWNVNPSGTDLGTNWLASDYGYTDPGWTTGEGLFGYTTSPASYPAIQTPLASGANTYYFTTAFDWTNDTAGVAFVVTNYLSDGAVYYLNGTELRRIRMPAGTITYATAATGTNSPRGQPDVFGIPGALVEGTNELEVETHQIASGDSDMVFGLSLTAATTYPVFIVSTNLPASQSVLAGQSVTFTSDVIGSGTLAYQWFFNGTNALAGANSSAYTIHSVETNNAGEYSLQVSNSFSSAMTLAALLTVSNTPVSITAEPVAAVAVEGLPATFSVAVSATPPIQYQWYFGTSAIAGATNATYTIADCLPANDGLYYVTVSNPASTTNSSQAGLAVLRDTIPPNITAIAATVNQIIITFSEPVDAVTSANAANYSVSGGVTVLGAAQNPANASQVVLTTGVAMNFGTAYTVSVNGVQDLFGNAARVSGQFARDITIDGSFNDWTGLAPLYSSAAPSGNTDAADFAAIYMYDDANYYYFRVTLWTDIDSSAGQFPYYVNMFFDTDNNPNTGYSALGFDMLVQSGYSYQEKDGSFNDGYGINGLNWLCLPASPGTNFEFQMSKAATFGQDGTPVFTTNEISFLFQGMTPGFVVENQVPASGVLSYTNTTPVSVATLPLGELSISALGNSQAAVVWNPPGTLQESSSLSGGSWTNLPSATSPYVIPVPGQSQFFRLTQ